MHFTRAVNCFSLRLPLNSNTGAWGWAKRGLAAVALSCALAQAGYKQRSSCLAEVRGIQEAANGSKVSYSIISPHMSSFRSAANTFTFSWEVGLVIETCQEQKLHHRSLQGEDMNSDTSPGLPCHRKQLKLFLPFIVLSLMRPMILLWCSRW